MRAPVLIECEILLLSRGGLVAMSSVMLKTNGFGSLWQSLGDAEGQMLLQRMKEM